MCTPFFLGLCFWRFRHILIITILSIFRSSSVKRQRFWNVNPPWLHQRRKSQAPTTCLRTVNNMTPRIQSKNSECTCENSISSNTNWKVWRYTYKYYIYKDFSIDFNLIIFRARVWIISIGVYVDQASHV